MAPNYENPVAMLPAPGARRFGMSPWIQLVLLARQQRQVAEAHRDLALLRAALLVSRAAA